MLWSLIITNSLYSDILLIVILFQYLDMSESPVWIYWYFFWLWDKLCFFLALGEFVFFWLWEKLWWWECGMYCIYWNTESFYTILWTFFGVYFTDVYDKHELYLSKICVAFWVSRIEILVCLFVRIDLYICIYKKALVYMSYCYPHLFLSVWN